MTLGGAAQLAAAHGPNEWTLGPTVLLIYLARRDGRLSWPEHHDCE